MCHLVSSGHARTFELCGRLSVPGHSVHFEAHGSEAHGSKAHGSSCHTSGLCRGLRFKRKKMFALISIFLKIICVRNLEYCMFP